jgi:hypothetical protein
MTYPSSTGRNFREVLRALDSMQLADRHAVATPANWRQGDPCAILPTITDQGDVLGQRMLGCKPLTSLRRGSQALPQRVDCSHSLSEDHARSRWRASENMSRCVCVYMHPTSVTHCEQSSTPIFVVIIGSGIERCSSRATLHHQHTLGSRHHFRFCTKALHRR